jgi:hypothetical protein
MDRVLDHTKLNIGIISHILRLVSKTRLTKLYARNRMQEEKEEGDGIMVLAITIRFTNC